MRSGAKTRPHTFSRLVFLVVSVAIMLMPVSQALAQPAGYATTEDYDATLPNTGNNPGNPNAPGYFGGSSGTTDPLDAFGGAGPSAQDIANGTVTTNGEPIDAKTSSAYQEVKWEKYTYGFLIQVGGWVAGLGGNALELSFNNFIIKMGCLFVAQGSNCSGTSMLGLNGQVGGVVNELWSVIRDLFNVIFIFGLIYLGLKTILQSDDSSTRKAIGNLLLAALLVNFSLYFAKLILDISNFTAVQIYNAMAGGISGQYSIDGILQTGGSYQIAGAFMETLHVSSWFANGIVDSVVFALFAMIFLVYLGFIFLYGAFMIMARFIAIVILLIFSPVMFLGLVLPGFKSYSEKWRKMFVSYCFFAPAYVFFLYMSLYTLIQLGSGLNGGFSDSFVDGARVEPGTMSIFIFFFVGTGLLFASTKVAGIMASSGAGATMNFASNWGKTVTTGLAGRYVGGKFGGGVLEGASEALEKRFGTSMLSRGLKSGGGNLKKNKFGGNWSYKDSADARDAGSKRAAGLNAQYKAAGVLKQKTTPTNLADKERAVAKMSPADVVAMAKTSAGAKILTANAALLRPDQIKALKDDKDLDGSTRSTILAARSQAVKTKFPTGDTVKKANEDELASLDLATLLQPSYAINLNEAKIDKLPQLVASEKQALKDARKAALISVVTSNATVGAIDRSKIVSSWSAEDIANLPDEVFDLSVAANRTNVTDFITALPTNAFVKIQDKKGSAVAREIRRVLVAFGNTTGSPREQAIHQWVTFDNVGKNFGNT